MTTFKERTKEELLSAFKQAALRKKAWEEEAQREFAEMRAKSIVVE